MSWVNVAKKQTKKLILPKKKLKKKILVKEDIIIDYYESLKSMKIQENLYNSLEHLKKNCETFTPWLLNKACTNDLLHFLNDYIDYKEEGFIYSSESEEEIISLD